MFVSLNLGAKLLASNDSFKEGVSKVRHPLFLTNEVNSIDYQNRPSAVGC